MLESTIRIDVNPLPASQTIGNSAFLQTDGDNEDCSLWLFVSYVERESNLLLYKTCLSDGMVTKTNSNHIGRPYCLPNFMLPILTG